DCVDDGSLFDVRSRYSGRSQWRQGWLPQIWRRPINRDAVEHGVRRGALSGERVDLGVGGGGPRRDLVVAGLAQHDAGDRRPLAVDPADGPEGEAAARRGGPAGLGADGPRLAPP